MPNLKTASPARSAPHGGPVQLFYQGKDAIRRPIVARAEGIYLYSPEGKRYTDLISGIGVSNIGHRHPHVVQAIKDQVDKHLHVMVFGEFIQEAPNRLANGTVVDSCPVGDAVRSTRRRIGGSDQHRREY